MAYAKINVVTELKKLAEGKATKTDVRTLAGLAAHKLSRTK